MKLKLVNPQNFQVAGRKYKEAAHTTANVPFKEIRAIKKSHFQFLDRNTERPRIFIVICYLL